MIGLLFFGAIALWALIALVLGVKLPEWLHIQRYRLPWTVVCVVLVFFAPVADEIIAYPQLQAMCAASEYKLTMTEREALGRTIYYTSNTVQDTLWPSTVVISRIEVNYLDSTSKQPVVTGRGVKPDRAFLGVPAGSSGDKMPVLLSNCKTKEALDNNGIPTRFSHLKFNVIPTP